MAEPMTMSKGNYGLTNRVILTTMTVVMITARWLSQVPVCECAATGAEQAVGRVLGSLCVVTAKDGDAQSAMLASWISQAGHPCTHDRQPLLHRSTEGDVRWVVEGRSTAGLLE